MSAKQEKKPSPVYVIMIFWKCTLYRIQVYQTPPKKLRIKERKKRAKIFMFGLASIFLEVEHFHRAH